MIHDEKTAEIEIPTNVVQFPPKARTPQRNPKTPQPQKTAPAMVMPFQPPLVERRSESHAWLWRAGAVLLILALSFLIF